MKVPAECPGEQSKDARKKLKQERQEAATATLKPSGSPSVAELPDLTRSNTTNSLSSGYAASAQRSIAGPMSPTEETPPEPAGRPQSMVSSGNAAKKNRVIAPPPTAYMSELPGSTPNGSSGSAEQKGKLLYTFDAGGDGELSVAEGREVEIVEPDSK